MAGENVEKSQVCMEKTTSVELTGSSMFLSGSATCFANPTIPLHGDEMETKGGSPPARTHSHGSAAAWGGGMSTRQEEDCSGLGGGGDVDRRIRLSLVHPVRKKGAFWDQFTPLVVSVSL